MKDELGKKMMIFIVGLRHMCISNRWLEGEQKQKEQTRVS